MQMWTCFDNDLIAALLEEIGNRQEMLTVWQSSSGSGRDKLSARVLKVEKGHAYI